MKAVNSIIIFLLLTTCILGQENAENKVEPFRPSEYPKDKFLITYDTLKFHDLLIDIIRVRSESSDYAFHCRSWLTVSSKNKKIYQRYFPTIFAVGSCYGLFIPINQPRKDCLLAVKLGDYDTRVFIIDSSGKVTETRGGGLYFSNDKRYLFSHSGAEDWLTVYDFEQGSTLFSEKIRPSLGEWYFQDNKYISPVGNNRKGDKPATYVIFDISQKKLITSTAKYIPPDPKYKLQNYLEHSNLIDCNCGPERSKKR